MSTPKQVGGVHATTAKPKQDSRKRKQPPSVPLTNKTPAQRPRITGKEGLATTPIPSNVQPPRSSASPSLTSVPTPDPHANGSDQIAGRSRPYQYTFPHMPGGHPKLPQQVIPPNSLFSTLEAPNHAITKDKLAGLLKQISSSETLDPQAQDLLIEIAEDFVESVTTYGCQLARLRNSDTLAVQDVALHLERNWNIRVPGYEPEMKGLPLNQPSDRHQKRLQAVKEAAKQQHPQSQQSQQSQPSQPSQQPTPSTQQSTPSTQPAQGQTQPQPTTTQRQGSSSRR